ncbi:MAG TPA: LamG domain-containing protein [Verrucomicrobiae bacterium]|nr:LamG domain-containing protein [Verrucomicrobiae bacterium]
MKTIQALGFVSLLFLLPVHSVDASPAETNAPDYRLTVDLRDGSRVIGESGSDHLKFHSALLGDLKLWVKDIRSVECVSSNSAKLMTTGGDTLMVWFADSEVTAKTSFGKVELSVDSIRKITVSAGGAAGARRPGLVALWSGEDNGKDSIGGNDAELTDMDFADGQVGRAFSLNGFGSWMKIPASPSLDVGNGDGLTISAWIKPSNVNSFHPILEWEVTKQKNAVSFWIGHLPQDHGVLFGNIGDDQGNTHSLCSTPGAVVSGQFQHIAMTYDKISGIGRLFVNGYVVAQENLGVFTPQTTDDLFISRRPADQPGDWTYNTFFGGLLDEVAIYNRALSMEEIQRVSREDNHGEPLPPSVFSGRMPIRQNHIGIIDDSN